MGKLRAGVVGVGHLGRHHARLYASLPETTLIGVVDRDPARAAEIAQAHGARVFPDVPSLAREVDLASVATPTVAHAAPALAFIEAGVPVLIEKPLAPDGAIGREILTAAESARVPVMVGHTERFHPAIEMLLERMSAPRFLEIHRLAPFVPRSLDVDVVLDLMIHDLDLCRYLLGASELLSMDASGAAALTEQIDIASVRLRFANRAAANLTASRISNERVRRIRVFEPGALFACDTGTGNVSTFRVERRPGELPQIVGETLEAPREEPLGRELATFARAVRGGLPMPCSGADGLAALDLALAIREAIRRDL